MRRLLIAALLLLHGCDHSADRTAKHMKNAVGHYAAARLGSAGSMDGEPLSDGVTGEYEQAIKYCRRVIAADRSNVDCMLMSGQSHAALRQLDQAKGDFESAWRSANVNDAAPRLLTSGVKTYVEIVSATRSQADAIKLMRALYETNPDSKNYSAALVYLVAQVDPVEANAVINDAKQIRRDDDVFGLAYRRCDGMAFSGPPHIAISCFRELLLAPAATVAAKANIEQRIATLVSEPGDVP